MANIQISDIGFHPTASELEELSDMELEAVVGGHKKGFLNSGNWGPVKDWFHGGQDASKVGQIIGTLHGGSVAKLHGGSVARSNGF